MRDGQTASPFSQSPDPRLLFTSHRPRHAIGPPVFVTSTDTAPLLLLSPSPLRPLLARLANTSTNRRYRGTLLRLDLMPTSAAVNELAFSPYKSVVLPPAHALSLQPTQDLEPFMVSCVQDSRPLLYTRIQMSCTCPLNTHFSLW